MISQTEAGLVRELQSIITLYLGTLLGGYSMGFSAVAIPDMKNDMRRGNDNVNKQAYSCCFSYNEDYQLCQKARTF